jgi:hypothetical protein
LSPAARQTGVGAGAAGELGADPRRAAPAGGRLGDSGCGRRAGEDEREPVDSGCWLLGVDEPAGTGEAGRFEDVVFVLGHARDRPWGGVEARVHEDRAAGGVAVDVVSGDRQEVPDGQARPEDERERVDGSGVGGGRLRGGPSR